MKLPKQLKVGASVYSVEVGTHNFDLMRSGNIGETDHLTRVIKVNSQMAAQTQRDTLFHEAVHCIARHANLDHDWGDDNEQYVERLETALLMLFNDNPELVRLLLPEATAEFGQSDAPATYGVSS